MPVTSEPGTRWAILRAAYDQSNAAADAGGVRWLTVMHAFGPDAFMRLLARGAEQMSVQGGGNWFILDWQTVTDVLMRLRHRAALLSEGAVVLEIEDCDRRLRLCVTGDDAGSEWTTANADVRRGYSQATRTLGPATASDGGCRTDSGRWSARPQPWGGAVGPQGPEGLEGSVRWRLRTGEPR